MAKYSNTRRYINIRNRTTTRRRRYLGGNVDYILKEINHLKNKEYANTFADESLNAVNGEFVVHKEFQVKLRSNLRIRKIYGYVIQKVEKKTDAYTIIDGIETKIDDITEFTSGYVKYMNESYYELFFIVEGKSIDGDNFQNGAILEYTEGEDSTMGPDDRTNTKGIITVKGSSWFIKSTENEVMDNIREAYNNSRMNVNNSDNSIDILGINWSLSNNTPANGLPYMSIDGKNIIERLPLDSNILVHNVEVKWNTTIKENDVSKSITISEFESKNSLNNV